MEVTCPSCGTRGHFDAIDESADSYCPACDFPLFWSEKLVESRPPRPAVAVAAGADDLPGHVDRQAGVKGVKRRSVVPCHNCDELNERVGDPEQRRDARCHRCGELVYAQPKDHVEDDPEPDSEDTVPRESEASEQPSLVGLWLGAAVLAAVILGIVLGRLLVG